MAKKTPAEIALEIDLQQCKKLAMDLMTEKNLLARQLEILASRCRLTIEQKNRLRQEAES